MSLSMHSHSSIIQQPVPCRQAQAREAARCWIDSVKTLSRSRTGVPPSRWAMKMTCSQQGISSQEYTRWRAGPTRLTFKHLCMIRV